MKWPMIGDAYDSEHLAIEEIKEVLVEYDGPRLFVAQTKLCLALFYMADENEEAMRFVVVPTKQESIEQLKQGLVTVYESLNQPLLWLVETDMKLGIKEARATNLQHIPEDVLPKQGLMLWPHLQPVFTLRAIGEGLTPGNVQASVIRQVVEGASTALRKAATYFLSKDNAAQPKQTLKSFYDLPAQHFAYNSFEVAFRLPENAQQNLLEDDVWQMQEIGKVLQEAIDTISKQELTELENLDILLLDALEKLSPPLSGVVTEFEVGGTLLNKENKTYRLDRDSSRKIRHSLQVKRLEQEKITKIEGIISEPDRDNLTCALRDTTDGKDRVCSFPVDLLDEVIEAFYHNNRVAISGRETLSSGHIEISVFDVV